MSLASDTQTASTAFANIKTAIIAKGQTPTGDVSTYATAISNIDTGGTIDSLTIVPTTSSQTITASGGVDGYSPITVNAVTSSIDANIAAGNIKSGVSILGVSGTVTPLNGETRTVSITSTSGNTFTPSTGKNGITSIKVNPTNQTKTITPTKSSQSISVPSGYSGFGTLTVNAVTSSIDNNIKAGNIKSGVSILGVSGTYAPTLTTKSITTNGTYNASSDSADGYSSVTVNVGGGSKFGLTIDNFIGDLNGSGNIDSPSAINGITFTGLVGFQRWPKKGLQGLFAYNPNISGAISFPDLTSVDANMVYPLTHTFRNTGITSISMPNVETIGAGGCECCCRECKSNTQIDLSKLETISGNNACKEMFYENTALTSVSLPLLETISGGSFTARSMFYGCSKVASISLPSLKTIDAGYAAADMFANCGTDSSVSELTVDISALESIKNTSGGAGLFKGCTKLVTVTFTKLSEITGTWASDGIFENCSNLTTVNFPAFTTTTISGNANAIQKIFNGSTASTSGTCTVHFPSNLQSAVSGLSGYPTFNGNSSRIVLAFDLTATS